MFLLAIPTPTPIPVPVMTETTAYSGLLDLITFIGSFITEPIWFGISFLQLLVISFIIHYVIGIALGGIAPRVPFERKPHVDRNNSNDLTDSFSETYAGGGKH